MKSQENMKGSNGMQGTPTADRAHSNHNKDMAQKGISNGGGQRSDQTSNRDTMRRRKALL